MDDSAAIITNEEWAHWLAADLRACAAYAAHAELIEKCCAIAAKWRSRFWERKALWCRIRRGRRLAKELAEVLPVITRVLSAIEEAGDDSPPLVIVDLCSGFGYMGMFLSELLPANKVERIVLVDKMWARHNVARKPHHISPEHIEDPGWPIRLTTSRADLKVPSDRRSLARSFFSHGAPAMLLGVHLCGTLSLRCIDLYNDSPAIGFLALKPCCATRSLRTHRIPSISTRRVHMRNDIHPECTHSPHVDRAPDGRPAGALLCQTRRCLRSSHWPLLPS